MPPIEGFTLCRAGYEDAAIITDLVKAAYAKWVPLIGRNPLPMDVDYTQALKTHRFDLLFDAALKPDTDKTLAALIETRKALDCLFLENLCVSPSYQRQGIGQRLLAQAERIARQSGHDLIKLDTNKLFTGNVELYRRMGYVIDWEKPVQGGIHVRMSKALSVESAPR